MEFTPAEIIEMSNRSMAFIEEYSVARSGLLWTAAGMNSLPDGPWTIQTNTTENEIECADLLNESEPGAKLIHGIATIRFKTKYPAIASFGLLGPDRLLPLIDSPAAKVMNRFGFYLQKTDTSVRWMLRNLPVIERLQVDGSNTEAISRLLRSLPEPPYVPLANPVHTMHLADSKTVQTLMFGPHGANPSTSLDSVIAEHTNLIEDAKLALHRLIVAMQGMVTAPPAAKTLPDRPITLDPDDVKILRALADTNTTMKQVELEQYTVEGERMPVRNRISIRLTRMRKAGLTHRPNTKKGGEAITDAGRNALKNTKR